MSAFKMGNRIKRIKGSRVGECYIVTDFLTLDGHVLCVNETTGILRSFDIKDFEFVERATVEELLISNWLRLRKLGKQMLWAQSTK